MSKSAEQRAAEVLDYTVGMTDRHVRFVRQAEAISALKSAGLLATDEMLAVVEAAVTSVEHNNASAYRLFLAAVDAYRASVKPPKPKPRYVVEVARFFDGDRYRVRDTHDSYSPGRERALFADKNDADMYAATKNSVAAK